MHDDAFAGYEARRQGGKTNGSTAPALWIGTDPWHEADIPLRPWVAPGYALRGAVTIVAGPPSAMKSSLMLAWACAVALGCEHGDFRPRAPGTVILYNVEDDRDEQRRRLSAALRQFDALPADIHGRVITTGPVGVGTLLNVDTETGFIHETPVMQALRVLLREHEPDMLIVDPLAELHTAPENDNTALRGVIACLRALAAEFDMAVVILHHTRKGGVMPGYPDTARGASSLVGTGRVVLTLCTMSEDDAEALGMAKDRQTRSAYVRLDDAKQNYAAIGEARWFEKIVYTLANRELVPAAVPWRPPDMWDGISTSVGNRILNDIEAGLEGGRRYSNSPHAEDRAAWKVVVAHVPSLSEKQARKVITTWVKNGTLNVDRYDDPVDRKSRSGLFVNNANRPGARR
jgi:hypothetical protein